MLSEIGYTWTSQTTENLSRETKRWITPFTERTWDTQSIHPVTSWHPSRGEYTDESTSMRYTGFRDKPGMTGTQWVLIEAEWATYRRAQREYRETRCKIPYLWRIFCKHTCKIIIHNIICIYVKPFRDHTGWYWPYYLSSRFWWRIPFLWRCT